MISGRDFVVLSDDWHGLPTSAIHLFRRLARHNRVFWFNLISRLPRFSRADARKVFHTLGAWAGKRPPHKAHARAPDAGVCVVNPVMVPWFKPWVRRLNCRSLLRKYRQLCDRNAITEPIVVTTFPCAVDFLKALPEATKIYYCVDDFLDYPGLNRTDWTAMETELLETVDVLVVTSRDLARKRCNACPVLYLPHGVDFDHFHGALSGGPAGPLPAGLRHPIVGFFGLIDRCWVDLELVEGVAEAFPDVSFVFLGRSDVEPGDLPRRPNLHWQGFIPYADLPRHARDFDIGFIPFVRSGLTRAANPLKLLEYFALGLPVLSTRLPELEGIDGPLWLADTAEEFRHGLRVLLENRGGFTREQAFAAARQNSWEERLARLSRFLEQRAPVGGKPCPR